MARRLEEAATPPPLDLLAGQGLSTLLQAAKNRSQREPWNVEDLDPTAPGLAGLLAQARLHRAAQQQGEE